MTGGHRAAAPATATVPQPGPRHATTTALVPAYPYPWYAAGPWLGMPFGAWSGLLRRNRFRISPRRLVSVALPISAATGINSAAAHLQRALFGRRIEAARVERPIFVLGHWRSGTTLLHELLTLDPRHAFPTSHQCFAPEHFLVTRPLIPLLSFLLPDHRPMDGMAMGWDLPQEDEFALCNMGIPSPYLTMAFPNEGPAFPEYLDLETVRGADRARWQEALLRFCRSVTLGSRRTLVLKSPPHTARIAALLEIFPDARFAHIVRDPLHVFPSTVRLWKTLYTNLALQDPSWDTLEEEILSTFERMYRAFEGQRHLAGSRLVDVRYEDLVRDPVAEIRAVYAALELDGFEDVEPRIERYLADHRDYAVHTYEPDARLTDVLERRWGPYMRRYGYAAGRSRAGDPASAGV